MDSDDEDLHLEDQQLRVVDGMTVTKWEVLRNTVFIKNLFGHYHYWRLSHGLAHSNYNFGGMYYYRFTDYESELIRSLRLQVVKWNKEYGTNFSSKDVVRFFMEDYHYHHRSRHV